MPYILRLPSEYLSSEEDNPKKAAVREFYLDSVKKVNNGESDVIILPSDRDENGHRMFEIETI